jgi:hypothetical protein
MRWLPGGRAGDGAKGELEGGPVPLWLPSNLGSWWGAFKGQACGELRSSSEASHRLPPPRLPSSLLGSLLTAGAATAAGTWATLCL